MSEFRMMIGLPGSGKSTYAKEHYPNAEYISSDAIREELYGAGGEQRNPGKVFELMLKRTRKALSEGRDVVYDATNLNEKKRRSVLNQIRDLRPITKACCIVAPVEICKARQEQRERKVPDYAIDRMVKQFNVPTKMEGFNEVEFVQNWERDGRTMEDYLERTKGMAHDNPHHEEDVDTHMRWTERIAAEAGENELMRKIMLYHDIGKADTKVFANAKGEPSEIAHFYGHGQVGGYEVLCCEDGTPEMAFLIGHHMDLYDTRGDVEKRMQEMYGPEITETLKRIHQYDKAAMKDKTLEESQRDKREAEANRNHHAEVRESNNEKNTKDKKKLRQIVSSIKSER